MRSKSKHAGKRRSTPRRRSVPKALSVPFMRPGSMLNVTLPWDKSTHKVELLDLQPRRTEFDRNPRKYSISMYQAANVKFVEGPNRNKYTTILLDHPKYKVKPISIVGKRSSVHKRVDQGTYRVSSQLRRQWHDAKKNPHYQATNK